MMRVFLSLAMLLFFTGCMKVEGGFTYAYEGKLFQPDGKTPLNNAAVRMARPDAPEAPDLPDKLAKQSSHYTDKADRAKSNKDGHYRGTLETVKGWSYSESFGVHSGPTQAPEPPVLDEVIVYVQPHGQPWTGYRLKLAPDMQKEASSGLRRVHLPDLIIPDKPATQPTTQPVGP